MTELKEKMDSIKIFLLTDTNKRVLEKLKEKEYKIYSTSHIKKVRTGAIYVPEIVECLIEVAKENKQKFDQQMSEIAQLSNEKKVYPLKESNH